jgi:hypothetical protein
MAKQNENPARIPLEPGDLLATVVSAVPATKYALGASGVLASAAVALGLFGGDGRVTFLAGTAAFLFATVTFVFARAASLRSVSVQHLATFLVGFLTLVFTATIAVLFSSVFFAEPLDLRWWIDPSLKQAIVLAPTSTVKDQASQPDPARFPPPVPPVEAKRNAATTAPTDEHQRQHDDQLFGALKTEDIRPSMNVFQASLKDDTIEATVLFYYTAGPAPGTARTMRYYERVMRERGEQVVTAAVLEQQAKILRIFAKSVPQMYGIGDAVQGPTITSRRAWVEGFFVDWKVRYFIPVKNRSEFLFTDVDYRIGLTGSDDKSFRFPLSFTFWKVPPDQDPQPDDGVQNVTRGVFESQRFTKIDRLVRGFTVMALNASRKLTVNPEKLMRRLGNYCEETDYCEPTVSYMLAR